MRAGLGRVCGRCLLGLPRSRGVQGASTADDANTVQYDDRGSTNQQWQHVKVGTSPEDRTGRSWRPGLRRRPRPPVPTVLVC
ncbi:hypothetical protein NKH18_40315 [Streptomyces sp. M10(2022)]